jgi:hypothetical protein
MSEIFDVRTDPFARATDLINPLRHVTYDRDGIVSNEPATPRQPISLGGDSPAMTAALAAMEEAGRRAPLWFGDRRGEWEKAKDANENG